MKGTKRFAMSDSIPDTNDTAFRNKRVMEGSSADVHRAEPSQQLTMTPPLDMQRAKSSCQHVRALNTQFASWVQAQLKNHPDELWEDGVRDYLAHASNIMEKFSDVVNWLKANAANGGSSSAAESQTKENKMFNETKNSGIKLSQEKAAITLAGTSSSFGTPWSSGLLFNNQSTGFPPASTTTPSATSFSSGAFSNSQTPGSIPGTATAFANSFSSGALSNSQSPGSTPASTTTAFATSLSSGLFSNNQAPGFIPVSTTASFPNLWSSGVFSNNQTPVSFGIQNSGTVNQSSVPTNCDATDDADGENELEQPSSPSVKKSEEKGIVVVHEVKCKLYVKSSDPADKDAWKDKGMGQLSIKCKEGVDKGTKESKPTIIVRNDVGKLLLNALLYPGIKTNLQKNSIVAIFHTSGDNDGSDKVVARTFLIRTKTEEDRNKLATAMQEYAPAS
ncbi:nuclear pore complex protein NUP98B [Quercus robur]|uniref:nuclear pore complex protein NUP98B n=1 Tax=Quercus robur TaxID=38942 RepID=UPI002161B9E3|nr:nuclear pore complex protein NUP98B [Quercus robur]